MKKENLSKKYYRGSNAKFYASSSWMERNQIKTSNRVAELLDDERIGGIIDEHEYSNNIMLDLGCGTGFSTLIFEDVGFRIIGIDISWDMLKQNQLQQEKLETLYNQERISRNLINAEIEHLPLRNNSIDIIISISAFNFVINDSQEKKMQEKILSRINGMLNDILVDEGRIVIEFYPKNKLDLFLNAFKKNFNGGLVIDNPGLRKEQKFLILKK